MKQKSLEDRVALLENEMQALRDLPGRVTSLEVQMVQFRAEVRAEFSATHEKIDTKIDHLSAEMHALHAVAMLEMGKAVERAMNQTMNHARMLHEEAMSNIRTIKNG